MKIFSTKEKGFLKALDAILKRGDSDTSEAEEAVKAIIDDIRKHGDKALLKYTERFDKVRFANMRDALCTRQEIERALKNIPKRDSDIIKLAAKRIRAFHKKQLPKSWFFKEKNGTLLGQRVTPLERVGIYVPGGKAVYPSTVLMNAIPAKVAGVKEIIMATPPSKNGINSYVLAAAKIAGVDKIDKVAGPSEILIINDGTGAPSWIAADLLSQAEHDELASGILLTTSTKMAEAVAREVEKQLRELKREAIARVSIERYGAIIITKNLAEAADIANRIAPEHLELFVKKPFELLKKIKNAGAIFLGPNTPEPIGDYMAGPNHTLPTGGTARFSSPLGTEDFIKRSNVLSFSKKAVEKLGKSVVRFTEMEGLGAHGKSVAIRIRAAKQGKRQL